MNRLFPGTGASVASGTSTATGAFPFDVEQPAAAALLVRRDVFEAVGGFDPAFAPAWFEDVDLCAKILESGYRIRFVPAARASHVGGTTMRALPYDDYLPLYTRNLLRYLRRHAGLPSRAAARAVLAAGALLRLALLPFVRGDHARARGGPRLPPRPGGASSASASRARSCRRRSLSGARPRLPRHAQRVPRRRAPPAVPLRADVPRTSSSSPSTTAPRTAPAPPSRRRRSSRRSRWRSSPRARTSASPADTTSGSAKAVERGAEWVLVLNADVVLAPDYLETLLADADRPGREWVGALTGKILRADGPELVADGRRRHRRHPDDAERATLRRRRGRARHGALGPARPRSSASRAASRSTASRPSPT